MIGIIKRMLNLKTSKRFKYYYDKSLSSKSSFLLKLVNKKILLVLSFLLVITLVSFHFYRLNNFEVKRAEYIKSFVVSFVKINDIKGFNDEELEILAEEINNASKKFEIDPRLILSVIKVESDFNKNAVSSVGARGLMQIMPSTARYLAKKLNIKYHGIETIYDIKNNIVMGTYYLSYLASKYNKNMKLYLAAYNRGPATIERILENNDAIPKDYYEKIMSTYQGMQL